MNFGLNVVYIFFAMLVGIGLDKLSPFGLTSLQSVLYILAGFCIIIILPYLLISYRNNQEIQMVENNPNE